MNLSPYLAELLKTNDCVIIPDLGGFIANYKASEYDAQSNQFSPPSKEVIFSGKLKKNDGLLVSFIGEREGVKYLEARKIVSEFVSECVFRLENGERIEFDEIGTLRYDQNEHLLFDAGGQKTIRTDVFGLEAFHFPPLVYKYGQPPKPVFRDKEPTPQPQRRPVVKYLLIGLPILAVLYLIPKAVSHDPTGQLQTSNTAAISLTDTPAAKVAGAPVTASADGNTGTKDLSGELSKNQDLKAPATVTPVEAGPKAVQPEASQAQTVVNEPAKGKFQVIGGCFKIRENADKQAAMLMKKGYPAQVDNFGKTYFRVTVESFQTRKTAEEALAKLTQAEPETGYWLLIDRK